MILKHYQINKINLDINKIILFYGKNEGLKSQEINNILKKKKSNIFNYEEKDIIDNKENFFNELLSNSFFEKEKIILINRATDKLTDIVIYVLEKNINDVIIVINSNSLEKKSKLRTLFEKQDRLLTIPIYPDTNETLNQLAQSFFRSNKIKISQENINIIINKCEGERLFLINELEKIKLFVETNQGKIDNNDLLKLVNLGQNHDVSELVDNCLIKNSKKTLEILNQNKFSTEDCILLIKTFLNKAKRLKQLSNFYQQNKNLELTINNAKPPIFWKDKEIVKKQINLWSDQSIPKLIKKLFDIELQIKKNYESSIIITTNFILSQLSTKN